MKYFPPKKASKISLSPSSISMFKNAWFRPATKPTFPILNLNKTSKIRGRRQGPECKQSFKEGLFPANIRLGEDVLKTSSRRLQDIIARRLEYVLKKTSWKTSWRRFWKTFCKCVLKMSWKRPEDVLEDKKMLRWRRLGKQEMFSGM